MGGLIAIIIVFCIIGAVFKLIFKTIGLSFRIAFWFIGLAFSILGWAISHGIFILLGLVLVGIPFFAYLTRRR